MAPNRRDVLAVSKALVASGLLAGCTESEPTPETQQSGQSGTTTETTPTEPGTTAEEPDTRVPSGSVERVVAGNTRFALDLLARLSADSANVFYSPYSVSAALAMTYAGARERTRTQMRETLHFPEDDAVHEAFRRLREQFESYAPETDRTTETTTGETRSAGTTTESGGTTTRDSSPMPFRLSSANALWGQEGYPFRDDYLGRLERNYGAGLRTVDYRSNPERARRRINDWVADETRGKITDLLPPGIITTMTRLVLTNAVYFRANWAKQFDPEQTADATFTARDGTEGTVPMMAQTETFPYASVDGHQVIELPYEGGTVSMVVVLPAEGEFEQFQQSLDADRLSRLVRAMEVREGTIRLPKFEYRSKFALKKTLVALGMADAFGPDADFTGMARGSAGERLSIADVIHEGYVAVDEFGTEAAAATAVVVEATAATTTDGPFEMTVDRPFLFFIRDRATGTVLFLGRVADAAAARSGG